MTGAWADTVSDGCTCRWASYGGGAWLLESVNPRCPHHGDGEHEPARVTG